MTTTINGITFADTPPTKPGAYWWMYRKSSGRVLVDISGDMWTIACGEGGGSTPSERGGLWSSRLVPVDEVMEAYVEGYSDRMDSPKDYDGSRARRVVEGEE